MKVELIDAAGNRYCIRGPTQGVYGVVAHAVARGARIVRTTEGNLPCRQILGENPKRPPFQAAGTANSERVSAKKPHDLAVVEN